MVSILDIFVLYALEHHIEPILNIVLSPPWHFLYNL
jgi:hypothetical protein